jgi:hypothetical protein
MGRQTVAKAPARNTRIWIDEHALSGYLSAAEIKVEQETVKVDNFLSSGDTETSIVIRIYWA